MDDPRTADACVPMSWPPDGSAAGPAPLSMFTLRPPSSTPPSSHGRPLSRPRRETVRSADGHGSPAAAADADGVEGGGGGLSPERLLEVLEGLTAPELRRRLRDALTDASEKDRRMARMQATVRELAQRLSDVSEFISKRDEVDGMVQELEHRHQQEIDKYRAEANEARMALLEGRVHLRAVEEGMRRTHEEEVERRAAELLDERAREVQEQRTALLQDKVLLSKDVEAARAQTGRLSQTNATLRRQLDLAVTTEGELLSRSVAQKREAAALRRQVKETEDNAQALITEYEERFSAREKAFEKQLRALTRERDDARNDAVRLQAELKRLRAASARLVQQRGELEGFFHAALADVRAHVLEERRQQLLQSTTPTLAVTAASTASAALRVDVQRQRLRLTDGKSTLTSSMFHSPANTRGRVWGTDSKGLPVLLDSAKVTNKALPPIPASSKGGCALDPGAGDTWQASEDAAAEGAPLHDTGASGRGGLAAIPDAPSWREAQLVDIKDLSWADKERVIRLLFKRVQQQQQQRAARGARGEARSENSTIAGKEVSDVAVGIPSAVASIDEDDDVFLTQQ